MDLEEFREARYVPDTVPESELQYFVNGGFGTRIGWGDQPAVVVVDMTEEFTSSEYPSGRSDTGRRALVANESLLDVAREVGIPVFFTKPEGEFPIGYRGTTKRPIDESSRKTREAANVIHPNLGPAEEEVVVTKPRSSAFFDTHFARMLVHNRIDTLVVTGMTTSGCVRATAVDAHSSNLRTIVPVECVADRSEFAHDASLFDLDMKYADVVSLAETVETLRSLPRGSA